MTKNTLLIFIIASFLAIPLTAHADSLTYNEAWVFNYRFTLSYRAGIPSLVGIVHIGAGDAILPAAGPWTVEVRSQSGEVLSRIPFSGITAGTQTIEVPYESRGYRARFLDEKGTIRLTVDLTGSRICDDNGTCDSNLGENADNCPTDCGTGRQAAIGHQAAIPASLLLVLADMAVISIVIAVDRRRRS